MMMLSILFPLALADDGSWNRCYPPRVKSEAWCREISVPVDNNDTRNLKLAVVKLPAIRPNPNPDPLFFLAGGPGQSAIATINAVEGSLNSIQKERDIIFVDQRGTGGSNALACDFPTINPATISSDLSTEEYLDAFKKCSDGWEIDAKYFTTTFAAYDLEAVRKEMGLSMINLYGVSYGTRLAQVYMRLFPENIRSVILDGVVPMNEPVGQHAAGDAQRVFDLLDQECRKEVACLAVTPSMKSDLNKLVRRLEETETVLAYNPSTGLQTSYQLTPELVINSIRLALYTPLLQRMLPYTIHEASLGHFEPIIAQTIHPSMKLNEVIEEGLYHAIHCSEDFPRISSANTKTESIMQRYVSTEAEKVCPLINVTPPKPDFFEPVRSDVPTLLLSGFRDPITPPKNGDSVSAGLTRKQHIVAVQAAHHVGTMPCAKKVLADFINKPNETTDGSCLEEATNPPWILTTAGGAP